MSVVRSEPLDPKVYAPYGDVIASTREDVVSKPANQGTAKRYDRLAKLRNLREGAEPNLCVFRSTPHKTSRFEVRLLERHARSSQVFIPMACAKRYLVVVCLGDKEPDLKTLRAFIAGKDQGVTYHPDVWHHPLIALDQITDFACLVWEDGSKDDCETKPLAAPISIDLK
jgi:ureidoglycolate lyase